MKTVPDVKKIAAKSFFGSIPCQKVPGVFFLFSACTLMSINEGFSSQIYKPLYAQQLFNPFLLIFCFIIVNGFFSAEALQFLKFSLVSIAS